jgi:uncharacterized protein YodC (DUF2158 family)
MTESKGPVVYEPSTDTMAVEIRPWPGGEDEKYGGEDAGPDLVIHYAPDGTPWLWEIEHASMHPEHIVAAFAALRGSPPIVFKVGDTVRLKSGGHLMTVASMDENSVTCDWSVRSDIRSKSFPAAELEKADTPPPPLATAELVQSTILYEDTGIPRSSEN